MSQRFSLTELHYKTLLVYDKTTGVMGSASMLTYSGRYFLITAHHVFDDLNQQPAIVFPLPNQGKKEIMLNNNLKKGVSRWIYDNKADLGFIEVFHTTEEEKKLFTEASIQTTNINGDRFAPNKEVPVCMYGYPLLRKIGDKLSSLRFETKAASDLIGGGYQNEKGIYLGDFFYLQAPSIQGLSGGPVFGGFGVESGFVYWDATLLVGVISSTASDNTGGKAALIVPAFYLGDLLKNYIEGKL